MIDLVRGNQINQRLLGKGKGLLRDDDKTVIKSMRRGILVYDSFARIHYENMPMQYTEIFKLVKNENFQLKLLDIFLIFAQNIDCGYTLEPPRRGGSNEYPQSMFWRKNKNQRTIGPENAHLKPDLGVLSHH